MHWYKRNIGDYSKKAGRLSMLQHGSYTLLIDACYDREQFPTMAQAIDWTWAASKEEIEAVEFVLRRFFALEDGVYVQKRIQEELVAYHEQAGTNKRIAEEREAKRRAALTLREEESTNRARLVNEPPPNQEPLTINHKPLTNTKNIAPQASPRKTPVASLDYSKWPEMPSAQIWADWLTIRKVKKAPVTQTVVDKLA